MTHTVTVDIQVTDEELDAIAVACSLTTPRRWAMRHFDAKIELRKRMRMTAQRVILDSVEFKQVHETIQKGPHHGA